MRSLWILSMFVSANAGITPQPQPECGQTPRMTCVFAAAHDIAPGQVIGPADLQRVERPKWLVFPNMFTWDQADPDADPLVGRTTRELILAHQIIWEQRLVEPERCAGLIGLAVPVDTTQLECLPEQDMGLTVLLGLGEEIVSVNVDRNSFALVSPRDCVDVLTTRVSRDGDIVQTITAVAAARVLAFEPEYGTVFLSVSPMQREALVAQRKIADESLERLVMTLTLRNNREMACIEGDR